MARQTRTLFVKLRGDIKIFRIETNDFFREVLFHSFGIRAARIRILNDLLRIRFRIRIKISDLTGSDSVSTTVIPRQNVPL